MFVEVINQQNILPKNHGDLGYDLVASSDPVFDYENQFIEYSTGVRLAPFVDTVHGLIFPRSSISNKWLTLANGVGVIDSSYRGEVKLRFRYLWPMHETIEGYSKVKFDKIYKKGDKIGQLVWFPEQILSNYVEVDKFSDCKESQRGEGGFGSTGE
jgi:dUTP pyrophosphatase